MLGALTKPGNRAFRVALHEQRNGSWVPFDLPASQWVTIWHPAVGLAHVQPTATGELDARSGPCEIVLRSGDSAPIRGSVAAWPAWEGGTGTFVRPDDTGLRHEFAGSREARIRGLAPGRYRLEYEFTRDPGGGPSTLSRADVRVTRQSPIAEVVAEALR